MTARALIQSRRSQSGNVFTMLFGAVALTGVLASVGMQTLTGPVTTITRVTQRNVAETNLLMNTKIIVNAAVTDISGGDADSDGIIEPAAFVAAGGETPPRNGEPLPTETTGAILHHENAVDVLRRRRKMRQIHALVP